MLPMLLLLAACPESRPSCATSVSRMQEAIVASVHTELERDVATQFAELVQQRCTEDGWSRDVRICVANATSFAEFDKCEEQMTAAQRDALRRPNR